MATKSPTVELVNWSIHCPAAAFAPDQVRPDPCEAVFVTKLLVTNITVTESCGGDRLLTLYQKTKKRHLDGVSRLDIRGH